MKVQVYSASRHLQEAEEAPSSVTVVTAEEIQRYGYRTLADVLRNVRGFYVTYDRNYSYVGVRGFAPLGDLNARILVMVDGHRLNDNIFDQALIGTDLPLDMDAVERIEIVRGPSSSLYGSNAFFGVINLITKSRSAVKHGQISSEIGSLGTYKGHFLLGETLPHGIEALLAGSVSESQGNYRLFFPEFNSPANNNGYAVNTDNDAAKNFLAKLVFHNFTLESVVGTREKGIPTASWDTAFNDARNKTIDSEGNLMLTYNRDLGETTNLFTRVSYNRYVYTGYYADLPAPVVLDRDMARGDWWGLEAQVRKRILRRHDLSVGGEFRDNLRQDMDSYNVAPYTPMVDVDQSSHVWAAYAQDEFTVTSKLIFNAGVRYDHYDQFGGSTNPRFGLLFRANEHTTLKLLYGQAFRAPNLYELYYSFPGEQEGNPRLRPESIRTYEAVLERYLGSRLKLSASGYYYRLSNLIRQTIDPTNGDLIFENTQKVHAKGLELEAQGKWNSRLETRVSYSLQRSYDAVTGATLANSPRHLVQANTLVTIFHNKLLLGTEGQYMSSRATLYGTNVGGFGIVNANLLAKNLLKGLDVSLATYNLFNKRYSDPGRPKIPRNPLLRMAGLCG